MGNVAERVNRHRRKLRQAGLRPIQIWVPDIRTPEFQEECHRQSRMLREDPQEQEILDWLKEAGDRTGWE